MDEKERWRVFAETGSVAAYLSYKASIQESPNEKGSRAYGSREHDRYRREAGEGGGLR